METPVECVRPRSAPNRKDTTGLQPENCWIGWQPGARRGAPGCRIYAFEEGLRARWKGHPFLFGFLYATLMVNSFLALSCTNVFQITYLGMGPTEIRAVFIILNTLVIFLGPGLLVRMLPAAVIVFLIATLIVVCTTQRKIWAMDMENKRRAAEEGAAGG